MKLNTIRTLLSISGVLGFSSATYAMNYQSSYVGTGRCIDSNNEPYDYVELYGVTPSIEQLCLEKCVSCAVDGHSLDLIAVETHLSSCTCYIENGSDFDTASIEAHSSCSSDDTVALSTRIGTGSPHSSNNGGGYTCYEVLESSGLGTNYQLSYVGTGRCIDSSNESYDYIQLDGVSASLDQLCLEKCISCVMNGHSLELVAFKTHLTSCTCYIENGNDFNPASIGTHSSCSSGPAVAVSTRTGTGSPQSSNTGGGYECYEVFQDSGLGSYQVSYAGTGLCVDSSDEKYDYIQLDGATATLEQQCLEKCVSCAVDGHGLDLIAIKTHESSCTCYIENGSVFDTASIGTHSSCSSDDTVAVSTRIGSGDPQAKNSGSGYKCYKVEGSGALASSYQLSYVGKGRCVDSNNEPYDYIQLDGVTASREQQCLEKCVSCAVDGHSLELVGINSHSWSSCTCYINDGNDFDTASIGTECSSGPALAVSTRIGTGTPQATNKGSGYKCYEVLEFSSEPSSDPSSDPSSGPSFQPSLLPSHSTNPTSEPSSVPSKSSAPSSDPIALPSLQPSAEPSAPPVQMEFEVKLGATMTLGGSTEVADEMILGTARVFRNTICSTDLPCAVDAKSASVNGLAMTVPVDDEDDNERKRKLSSLPCSLQVNSNLEVQLETLILAQCGPTGCTYTDAEELGTQICTLATEALKTALQDGSFISDLQDNLSQIDGIQAILDATTASVEFEDCIIPILQLFPSSSPSSMPSCTPSSSPTDSPSTNDYSRVNLFYPNWDFGDQGCRNDGDEPNYMAADPIQWLSSTLEACCNKWFSGFMYNVCVGKYPPEDDCLTSLYYPDWQGSNKGCIADGQEPLYMLNNNDYFLSNTLTECCEKFYPWDLNKCTGTTPILTNGEYYPDWEANSGTCLNDGNVPTYMLSNQISYMFETLEKCCNRYFSWDINKCLGNILDAGSKKWYVKWSDSKCVQDCPVGVSQCCGGLAESWDVLHSSQEDCCEEFLYWVSKRECLTAY